MNLCFWINGGDLGQGWEVSPTVIITTSVFLPQLSPTSSCFHLHLPPSPQHLRPSRHVTLRWLQLISLCRAWPHSGLFVVFQSSAAARGSLLAAVGRCSVSPCPGSVTAGRRVTTRATRWTVLVSIADRRSFTSLLLPNNHNRIDLWKEYSYKDCPRCRREFWMAVYVLCLWSGRAQPLTRILVFSPL